MKLLRAQEVQQTIKEGFFLKAFMQFEIVFSIEDEENVYQEGEFGLVNSSILKYATILASLGFNTTRKYSEIVSCTTDPFIGNVVPYI